MTVQYAQEYVLEAFPGTGTTFIDHALAQGALDFTERTQIVKDTDEITGLASTTSYAIPSDVIVIERVAIAEDNVPVAVLPIEQLTGSGDSNDLGYRIVGNNLHIGYVGTQAWTAITLPYTVVLYVRRRSDSMTEFVADVPSQFHEAPVFRAMRDMYMLQKDLQMSAFYNARYEELILRGRKHTNVWLKHGTVVPIQYDM